MILYHGTNADFGDIGLYHQSPRYVYSFLDSELKTGSVK